MPKPENDLGVAPLRDQHAHCRNGGVGSGDVPMLRNLRSLAVVGACLLGPCALTCVWADDVSWLFRVQTAPPDIPRQGIGTLAPLLIDQKGQAIATRDGWEEQRKRIRDEWRKFLGPMPDPRPAVKLEVLKTQEVRRVYKELVRYECEPGMFVEGYLLRRIGALDGRKRPGIVAFHQTTQDTIDEVAGVSGPRDMWIGESLVHSGFVVFCPRCFLWQDAANFDEAVARHRRRHPQSLGMAKMLYDAMRGVDVLASLPDVDADHIGAVGHSLGAKETLYLAAFDERIKAAVASEGGLGFRSTNWDAPWYLGPAIRDEGFPLNHHQLLALIAPRPFLILGGEAGPGAADGDRSWPLLEAALPVWKLYGEPTRLGLRNHHRGHALPNVEFFYLNEWLKTYVK
jgi:dienelactone hydrolase